jgi:hypothetical protein
MHSRPATGDGAEVDISRDEKAMDMVAVNYTLSVILVSGRCI